MAQHRIGGRIDLSPTAEKRYLKACKVKGGQTLFLEEAIEFYVRESEIMDKLELLEKLLLQHTTNPVKEVNTDKGVAESKILTMPSMLTIPATEKISEQNVIRVTAEAVVQQQEHEIQSNPDTSSFGGLDEATVYTLRSLIGDDAFESGKKKESTYY